MRDFHACASFNTQPSAPIAAVMFSVAPTGSIRTNALNVEVGHVPALLAAMDALRGDLERFVLTSRQSAKVIEFPPR